MASVEADVELSGVPAASRVSITVAYSPRAGEVDVCELSLAQGACVADALRASGLASRHPDLDLSDVALGVWGAVVDAQQTLRDRDRVEVYRPLLVDPMDARRRRHQQQREQWAAAQKARKTQRTQARKALNSEKAD